MAEFKITREAWETHAHLEFRHLNLGSILELMIEDKPVSWVYLDLVEMAETALRQLGYCGLEVDVATYAENRFRLEDEGIVASLWP